MLVLAGCKARKQIAVTRTPVDQQPTVGPAKTPAKAVDAKLIGIRAKQLNFNTFSGKAKTKLDIDGDKNDATLNIRIQRDKKIWVSVTYLIGIEVARAMITPDSIIVINKLQGVYFKKPFSFIYQYAGKQVNYKTVESLLIGNAIPELLNDRAEVGTDGANTLITGNLQDMLFKLIIGPDYKVSQTTLNNSMAAQSLQVSNSAFIQADGRVMPSQIDIASAVASKNISISMRYSNAEFDKVLEYPFVIPDRYTPVN